MKSISISASLMVLLLSGVALAQEEEKGNGSNKMYFWLSGSDQERMEQDKLKEMIEKRKKGEENKENQDSPKQPKKRCDVATTEKCKNCEECKKDLTDKDLKDGKCSKCEKEPKEVEYCVKKTWKCECENAKPKTTEPKVKECKKCKKEFKEEVNKCKVTGWVCPKCDKKSDKEGECDGEKCTGKDGNKTKFVKTCEKSGEAPHLGGKGAWDRGDGGDDQFKCEHGKLRFQCPECKGKKHGEKMHFDMQKIKEMIRIEYKLE